MEVDGLEEALDESDARESSLFFEFESKPSPNILTTTLPSPPVLSRIMEVFVDRVDPLLKFVHVPTFRDLLDKAAKDPKSLSRPSAAATIAFCFATISALDEGECQAWFGMPKMTVYSRYRAATRQALANARFLSTTSQMTLRAYALFMVS